MLPQKFQLLHPYRPSAPTQKMIQTAVDIMKKTRDPLHDQNHIFRIIGDLHRLISNDPSVPWNQVNFEVLLLSICWHDVWRSLKRHRNKRTGLYHWFYEGSGSARMFYRYANRFKLNHLIAKKTAYAIRKHSGFQILPRTTIESKILNDLDRLEEWSFARIKTAIGNSRAFLDVSPKLIRLYKFYFDHWMQRSGHKPFYFSWSKKVFPDRRDKFTHQTAYLLKEITLYWFSPHPTASSPLRDKNSDQLSKNLKMILNGASRTKSKIKTRKFSRDTSLLNQLPTTTIGNHKMSPQDDRLRTPGLNE